MLFTWLSVFRFVAPPFTSIAPPRGVQSYTLLSTYHFLLFILLVLLDFFLRAPAWIHANLSNWRSSRVSLRYEEVKD